MASSIRFTFTTIAFAAALVSADTGCGIPHHVSGDGDANGPFTVSSSGGGGDRQYIIHVPAAYDPNTPTPLIVSYHGHGKTMYDQKDLSQFADESLNPDMLVVFPQGFANAWEGAPYASGASDKVFTTDLLNHLRGEYCIDDTRIYANGKSNGGGFVGTLACSPEHGGDFAAFSACSGAFYTDNGQSGSSCTPARSPMPFMEFHGSDDQTIYYDGGLTDSGGIVPPIPEWLGWWAERDGCNSSTDGKATEFEYNGQVNHTTWDCNGIADIVDSYWIQGMGHDWPSTSYNKDNDGAVAPLDATPLILDFFRRNYKP